MTVTNDNIIKAERRGRFRYIPEQREAQVKACQAGGLSTPRFAAIHGVKYQTLAACIHLSQHADNPARILLSPHVALVLG
jgi:hypothetical protein